MDIGDEKRTLPADLKILGDREAELTISEGRFHQVKRMFASVGCKVTYLKRISMGTLTLGKLEKATYRKLTEQELASLKKKRKINNHQEYKIMYEGYLPISKQDMQERGIKQLDFVYVCGDAYVDHPSFGHAIIARLLEAHGYTVGIIAQPDWKDDASISVLGVPRLGFLVSAGNMDSMVNHYSVSKKRRATDSYTPGGVMGKRPDYATVVYCNLIRHTYKKTPIIIGGIEASLRRLAHYDYWSNKVKRSILLDSGADLISYGMGEHSIIEIADALNAGIDVHDITFIDGTVFKTKNRDLIYDAIELPDYDEIKENKRSFAQSFYKQYCNTDPFSGKRLFEPYGGTTFVVQNPPAKPLTQTEMDEVYALPYMRNYHPSYEKDGGVPAIREIKFSLISNRGCFGGCSFCALTFHQGRIIQTRSHESIIDEAKQIIQEPDFKGISMMSGDLRRISVHRHAKSR